MPGRSHWGVILLFATYHYNKLQYGVLPFDRTHVLRFYYVYNLPKVSTKWNIRAVRWVLDDWRLSGISQFQSGFPQSLNCQFTYPVNLFGGGDYTGAQVNGQLHRSYRIISRDKSSSC